MQDCWVILICFLHFLLLFFPFFVCLLFFVCFVFFLFFCFVVVVCLFIFVSCISFNFILTFDHPISSWIMCFLVNDTSSQLKHDNNTDIARFDHFVTRILLFYGFVCCDIQFLMWHKTCIKLYCHMPYNLYLSTTCKLVLFIWLTLWKMSRVSRLCFSRHV